MALIGDVKLTNKEGMYLGEVSLSNLNLSPNQLVYSTDGINLSGLNVGSNLSVVGGSLEANSGGLVSNSYYVNEGVNTIQSAIDTANAADTIFISSGSYNEAISLANKNNIALICPSTNVSAICEVQQGVSITGTSQNIRLSNLNFDGATSILSGVGSHVFSNVIFTGTALQTHNITIGSNSTSYMTFRNCEFNQYCNITVANTFANVIYFINCNFQTASLSLQQASATQVIFNNCANFSSFPVNATFVGTNVLSSGLINTTTTQINGSAPVSVANQADNRVITSTATTNGLNGEANLTFDGTTLTQGSVNYHTTSEVVQINDIASVAGDKNVAIGHKCRGQSSSVSIGYDIGKTGMSGNYNVLIGRSTAVALTTGNGCVVIGGNAGQAITTGINNTIVGVSSGSVQTTQSNNTIVGYFSNCANAAGTQVYLNCSILGANIRNGVISANNQVQLGDSDTTTYAYGAVQDRSDARDKCDIRNSTLGLNFINELRPVDFRWDYREDYKISHIDENHNLTEIELPKDGSKKRQRYHHGLIAQEVKGTMDKLNIDFGGYQNHAIKGGEDRLTLGYEEFIAPLIKAVQELSARVKELETKLSA